jgi:dephospho-CoA kinase
MIIIGIVGNIGSGKSFVAKQFGYPVFNADMEVDKIYKQNRSCFKKLKKKIPNYIFTFPIKKKEIINSILAKKNNLKKIIKVVHPEIRLRMNKFIKKNRHKKIVILDIPLLLENKINQKKDILVFVQASTKEIDKRLKKRLNFSPKILKKFRKLQLPIGLKKKRSHFIIKNNFNKNSVKKNVKMILKNFL